MESVEPSGKLSIRNARLLGIVFLAYSIVVPFISFLIPESELPVSTGPIESFSWLMILLMPVEILLLYVSYRNFGKNPELDNIMAPAILMYIFATAPAIFGFVIGFIGSTLRLIAIPLGMAFSLVGFWLAWMFISTLWETITSSNQ
jgi:hypothetical protein